MKPEGRSRHLLAVTRAKGKMFELGIPLSDHIALSDGVDPSQLLILAVATLGDLAASLIDTAPTDWAEQSELKEDLGFAATYFDAFNQSRLGETISNEVRVLASAAYYLADRPGSSFVLADGIAFGDSGSESELLLKWILRAKWEEQLPRLGSNLRSLVDTIVSATKEHFMTGGPVDSITSSFQRLRDRIYADYSPRDLLYADVAFAVLKKRILSSAWLLLPSFSGTPSAMWNTSIRRRNFPKELWPSQVKLGLDGFYSEQSGIIQMPTSAGKTRAIEIILRSAFLSGRATMAVVIAPFRALCHEISNSLRNSFREEAVQVNEVSDVLDADHSNADRPAHQAVLVLTPEKLLYLLRQDQSLVQHLGLVVYDEGHQFDTGSRGITYELLLTEIKHLLPREAQSILISAVIRNAQAVGTWLIGPEAKVATGTGLIPTSRSVAFPSWKGDLGRLYFYDNGTYEAPDYFVPKVIVPEVLQLKARERKPQVFPLKGSKGDLALYLGLRLVRSGAVAVFCGTKKSAIAILKRAVDVYSRGFSIAPPGSLGSAEEIARLARLIDNNFGDESLQGTAARNGIFAHHSSVPHGIRVAVEHAMHRSFVNFVVCTSTLAQGVNMPIRYLIVAGTDQGGEQIKGRDFQNLIGRAGRSGMHTEGLIVFSDIEAVDSRRRNPFPFERSVDLLDTDKSEATTSSLLDLVRPVKDLSGESNLALNPVELAAVILSSKEELQAWAENLQRRAPQYDAEETLADLSARRRQLKSVESYLMANRGASESAEFVRFAEDLATRTLAYTLADDEARPFLVELFRATSIYLEEHSKDELAQARYSKTLLGIEASFQVEQWTVGTLGHIDSEQSCAEWAQHLWPLFSEMAEDRLIATVAPPEFPLTLTLEWLEGKSYKVLFDLAKAMKATKPFGLSRRTAVGEDSIMSFLETTIGFQISLLVAAVGQTLEAMGTNRTVVGSFRRFQKSLKYGLPTQLSCKCFEVGFGDRELAKKMESLLQSLGLDERSFEDGLHLYRDELLDFLRPYPEYFTYVLRGITG